MTENQTSYQKLVRQARHYVNTAVRFRKAGDYVRARQCLDNGRKAVAAAEREVARG